MPKGFETTGISFVTATEGFAFGRTETCARKPCTSVLRTRDAGVSWVGIPAPRAPQEDDNRSTAHLTFADPLDGFAWGPGLWATHNGGATWHEVRIDGRVLNLAAGARRIYAVTTRCPAAKESCTLPATLMTGPATGDAFSPVTGVDLYTGELSYVTTHGLAVWVTAGRNEGQQPGQRLYESTDGRTFISRTVPCKTERDIAYDQFNVAASGDVNLALTCASGPGAGMQEKQEWTSADSGQTWTRAGDPPDVSGDDVFGFAATTQGTFLSDRSGLEVTRDGKTWTMSYPDGGGGAQQVGFVTDDLGFLVDSEVAGGLLVSRDAGQHWSPVHF